MMPASFRPNLAATLTKPELINFPVYASPKIDGIRCVVFGGVAYSRSLKPIPNEYVQEWARAHIQELDALDGELVVGSDTDPNCMQNSMAVMRKLGEPDFTFHVFDVVGAGTYEVRARPLQWGDIPRTTIVPQRLRISLDELYLLEKYYLAEGYEGMMIRNPESPYKYGRSTERDGGLVKVKRFTDAEAEVIGFVEEQHNTNEAKIDAFGCTERSTEKAGLVGKGTLGAFVVSDHGKSETFNIGTGFTAAQRADFWNRRSELLHTTVKYKSFQHGVKDAPRHPVFLGFRHKDDVS